MAPTDAAFARKLTRWNGPSRWYQAREIKREHIALSTSDLLTSVADRSAATGP